MAMEGEVKFQSPLFTSLIIYQTQPPCNTLLLPKLCLVKASVPEADVDLCYLTENMSVLIRVVIWGSLGISEFREALLPRIPPQKTIDVKSNKSGRGGGGRGPWWAHSHLPIKWNFGRFIRLVLKIEK